MDLISFLLIGALAGWIAAQLMKGGGYGLLGNIVLGVIGSLVGGYVFSILGITTYGFLGSLLTSVVGSALILWIASLFAGSRSRMA